MLNNLLIPVRRCLPEAGELILGEEISLGASAPQLLARQLREDLARAGITLKTGSDETARLRLISDPQVIGDEAYHLEIAPRGIQIRASGQPGLYYGVQTLRELLRASPAGILPFCSIDDAPDFRRRGVYLDCSRGRVPTTRRLKDLIELLAHWKVNELQLYIENVFRFRRHPEIGRGYSPFSPEDILALQEHCRQHHVRFVGSLASFGHMEKVLQIPRYRGLGEMPGFQGWPGGTTLCPLDPRSFQLVEDLFGEFLPLFKAEDFNVCGDEPWELGRGRSILRARWFGVARLYVDFLKKLQRLCERHNKRMNAWGDIVLKHADMLGELPRDMVLLNWDYDPPGSLLARTHEITDLGLPAVACPGTHGWFSHGSRLEMGMWNIEAFAAEGLKCGTEGLLNTDWGNNGHRNLMAVSLHNFAWGAAHAWNHAGTQKEGFTQRFCRQTFGDENDLTAAASGGRASSRSQARSSHISPPVHGGAWEDLAEAIIALGGDLPADPPRRWDAHLLYNGLIPSVQASYNHMEMALDALEFFELDDFRQRDRLLSSLRWPQKGTGSERKRLLAADKRSKGALLSHSSLAQFLADSLEEYRTAAQMEILSCRRCHVLKRVREGGTVSTAEWKDLIDETKRAATELARVWRLGNRPSRLGEHLRGFKATITEYRQLMRSRSCPHARPRSGPGADAKKRAKRLC